MERLEALRARLGRGVPALSLGAFRIAFGLVMVAALARFAAMGWIDELYVAPRMHFHYFGLGWVRALPAPWIYLHFAVLGGAAACVALGLFYRVAIVVFTILFAWVEALDAATYLNHYYAITLVAVLLCAMPAERAMSIDAWRARRAGSALPTTVPVWTVALLRAQLGVVYFFAGVAKLNEDWLLRGEPLHGWLLARSDLPVLGPLLELPATPLVMSWGGALFDLSIPFLLLSPRTRGPAYVAVIVFHAVTGWIFPSIGVFPWVMVALTPIFFAPEWPARFLRGAVPSSAGPAVAAPMAGWALTLAAAWLALQVGIPMRHLAYPGDVLWTQEGMRWSWRVMVAERAAVAEVWLIDEEGRRDAIDPAAYLTPLQLRMMSAEPDLLVQFAHHLHEERRREGRDVEVHAEVWAALNGHPSRRLVDPSVDLAAEEETLLGHAWLR